MSNITLSNKIKDQLNSLSEQQNKLHSNLGFVVHNENDIVSAGFIPPCEPIFPGQFNNEASNVLIYNIPTGVSIVKMVEAFQATKIDPPCFLLDFADLGPGQEILGSPVLGQEIYAKYGLTKSRVTSSINSYKLPIFYAPTDSTRSQPLANSLDINKYLLEKEIETKRKVLRKEYRRVARGRVLDPLFRTSGRRKKAEG